MDLTLDLVVVTAYEIGQQRILVPQLVEPDRTQVTARLAGEREATIATEIVPGATESQHPLPPHPLNSSRNYADCSSGPKRSRTQDWQRSTRQSASAGGC